MQIRTPRSNSWFLAVSWCHIRFHEDLRKVKGMGGNKFSEKVKLTHMKQLRTWFINTELWNRNCQIVWQRRKDSGGLEMGKISLGCIHQERIWPELWRIGWICITMEAKGRHSRQQGEQKQAGKQKCHANVIVCPNFNDSALLWGDVDLIVICISSKSF